MLDADAVTKAVAGQDAVVVTLGIPDNPFRVRLTRRAERPATGRSSARWSCTTRWGQDPAAVRMDDTVAAMRVSRRQVARVEADALARGTSEIGRVLSVSE